MPKLPRKSEYKGEKHQICKSPDLGQNSGIVRSPPSPLLHPPPTPRELHVITACHAVSPEFLAIFDISIRFFRA
jgi:hypothetical protein